MTRKQRQHKKDRARAHQAQCRARNREQPQLLLKASKPPGKSRNRPLPKRRVRSMGRQIRPEQESSFMRRVFSQTFGITSDD